MRVFDEKENCMGWHIWNYLFQQELKSHKTDITLGKAIVHEVHDHKHNTFYAQHLPYSKDVSLKRRK